MRLIDALYINSGGGKRLLEYLIDELCKVKSLHLYFFLLDRRLLSEKVYENLEPTQYAIISPRELGRIRFYLKFRHAIKSVLCLANVPPPISFSGIPITIMFHNNVLFGSPSSSWFISLSYKLKVLYIRVLASPRYFWITQTSLVKDKLINYLHLEPGKVKVLPFYQSPKIYPKESNKDDNGLTFIYPAEGYRHKNHDFLFAVWHELKNSYQLTPTLILTLSNDYSELLQKVKEGIENGLQINNVGSVSTDLMDQLYQSSDYLIFPSREESFGLPLIEAVYAGLSVIAVDKPYVHAVVKPSSVFAEDNKNELIAIIMDLSRGIKLPPPKVIANNMVSEFIRMITTMN